MRVRKGLEVAWGQRRRSDPTGFNDIDSDEETLSVQEARAQARELSSRGQLSEDRSAARKFVLIREGEGWLGQYKEEGPSGSNILPNGEANLAYAYGLLGEDT
jgi:hypothetical protein